MKSEMGFAAKKSLTKLFFSDAETKVLKETPLTEWSDESLMAAYQKGNVQAFQVLLARHQKPVFHFLYRFLKNHEAAEEAFQEVFLRLVRARHDYKPSAKFTTWLYTLARHYCIDQLRKKKYHDHSSYEENADEMQAEIQTSQTFESRAEAHQLSSAKQLETHLENLLGELSPEQKEVFVLREVQGLPFEDIANITAVPVNTVKSRMRYALQFLKKRFKQLGVTPND